MSFVKTISLHLHRKHSLVSNIFCVMATPIADLHKKVEQHDEHVSIRSNKKRRARQHFLKKYKKNPEKLDDDVEKNSTEYYIENGLRKVYPYYFNFKTYTKERWFGRNILEVFTAEFKGAPESKYKHELDQGSVKVNGEVVSSDYILGGNQLIEHTLHRHENPVMAMPIEILAENPDVLVINKPSSLPCHPCGRYRYNSILYILEKEYGYKSLRVLYRLDRLTSGVLILPRTTSVSRKMEKQLANKEFVKEYVCRVVGEFPEGPVECNEPLGTLSRSLYVQGVVPHGKPSNTTFTRLSFNGKTSVVKCVPHTGRTHQIRVHLQYLGYPIVNDPLYNSPAFGPNRGKGGLFDRQIQEIEEEVKKLHNTGLYKLGKNPLYEKRIADKRLRQSSSTDSQTDAGKTDCSTVREVNGGLVPQLEDCDGKDSSDLKTESEVSDIIDSVGNGITVEEGGGDIVSVVDGEGKTKNEGSDMESTVGANRGRTDQLTSDSGIDQVTRDTGDTPPSKKVRLTPPVDKVDAKLGRCGSDHLPDSGSDLMGQSGHSDTCGVGNVCTGSVESTAAVSGSRAGMLSQYDESKMSVDENCENCQNLYKDPTPSELVMYLHAVRYKGPNFDYSAPLPDWACEDWQDPEFS